MAKMPLTEFARRICVANHAHFGTTGSPVPCGQHIAEANRLWGLSEESGSVTLGVILEVRQEEGLPTRLPPKLRKPKR